MYHTSEESIGCAYMIMYDLNYHDKKPKRYRATPKFENITCPICKREIMDHSGTELYHCAYRFRHGWL